MSSELDELQIKVAFLESALDKLSGEYYQQQKQLEMLTRQITLLNQRLQQGLESSSEISANERPPHY